ncbi:MAG: 4Fe-4S dicluster domain-containing protein, partial [Desulfobacteraceae bacterium]|nr:4Fe-4S dicluster domain-containing protein [Desulfobacteraceae bacterium]
MNQRLGLIIDQERCIGCEACTVACIKENKGQSGWIRVESLNSPHKDTPVGIFPEVAMHFLPTLCNHCQQPTCADACPLAAITKS